MFEVLRIGRINKSVGFRGNLNLRLLRDAFPYRLANTGLLAGNELALDTTNPDNYLEIQIAAE
jgi:hypothetical protein